MNEISMLNRKKKKYNLRSLSNFLLNNMETFALKRTKLNEVGVTTEKRDVQLVVSMTSFPARITIVDKCIKTILNQTVKPDRVILWLATEQFPDGEESLPMALLELKNYGLEIKWCKDYRSYKKLVPAYDLLSECILVTADDDQYYSRTWLEKLYLAYLENPELIQCHIVTKLCFDKECGFDFISGGLDVWKTPSYLNKLVGCGGVLYPPGSLNSDCYKSDLFMKLAPTNDDVWFWFMAILNERRIAVVKDNIVWKRDIVGTNESALYNVNNKAEVMKQFKNLLEYYPTVKERLIEETKNI